MFKLLFLIGLASLCNAVPTTDNKYYNNSGTIIKCTPCYWTPSIHHVHVEDAIIRHLEKQILPLHWIQIEQTSTDTIYYDCASTNSDAFEMFKPMFLLLATIMISWQLIGCLFRTY